MVDLFNYNKSFVSHLCVRCGLKVSNESGKKKLFCKPKESKFALCSEYCQRKYQKFFDVNDDDTLFVTEKFSKIVINTCDDVLQFKVSTSNFDNIYDVLMAQLTFFVHQQQYLCNEKFSEFYFLMKIELFVRCSLALHHVELLQHQPIVEDNLLVPLCLQFAEMLKEQHLLNEAESVILMVQKICMAEKLWPAVLASTVDLSLVKSEKGLFDEAMIFNVATGSLNPQIHRKIYRVQLKCYREKNQKDALGSLLMNIASTLETLFEVADPTEHIDVLFFLAEYVTAVTSLRLGWSVVQKASVLASDSCKQLMGIATDSYAFQRALCCFMQAETKAALVFGDQNTVKQCIGDYEKIIVGSSFCKDFSEYADFYSTKALCMEKFKEYEKAIDLQIKALGIYRCFTTRQKKEIQESYKLLERHTYLAYRSH